jgi:hypothetical protein
MKADGLGYIKPGAFAAEPKIKDGSDEKPGRQFN